MFLIAGLGNPGREYEKTRHNMGFDVIDEIIERNRIPQTGVKFNAMYGKGIIGGEKVILMKPLTFMNRSGDSVRPMADYFKIDKETERLGSGRLCSWPVFPGGQKDRGCCSRAGG